jgi:acetyl-CoA C-acetyltransferase
MKDIYILDGKRSPLGNLLGSLANLSAPTIAGSVIKSLVNELKLDPKEVSSTYMGQVLQAGVGQAPARQASLFGGLPESTNSTTINKVCGSGMQSIIQGAQELLIDQHEQLVIAGGMENMSQAPFLMKQMRAGHKYGNSNLIDSMEHDGLFDVYSSRVMGLCAEECAEKFDLTREQQDEFAIESYRRSQASMKNGTFAKEITPIEITNRRGQTQTIDTDEGPLGADFEKMKKIRTVFKKEGTITAANASTINDGAAICLLGGEKWKSQAKFKIKAWSRHAHNPTWFTTAPVTSIQQVLKKTGLNINDIDLFEINEAFSLVPMVAMRELNIPHDKVNILGGAISLGHPIGCSGTRIVVTLMNALENQDKILGLASICIGGGEALSLVIERI